MHRPPLFALAVALAVSGCTEVKPTHPEGTVVLHGAGATFPNPLYKQWCEEYHKSHSDVAVEYAAVGSGEGVKRFLSEEVDFGASDGALTDAQMKEVRRGAQLVPMTAGAIAVIYNLPGVEAPLKLKRDVYVDIFLGNIKYWNDPRIQASNPGVDLPQTGIARVARQDSSGTTFAFTNHLSAISEKWRNGPGVGYKVAWPGSTMLAQGNEGVAARVKHAIGAVGYVEYGYAHRLGLVSADLENKEGAFVSPSGKNGLAALRDAQLPANFREFFPDPAGKEAYPIVTYTWLLLYRQYPDSKKGNALKQFVTWCLHDGQQFNEKLGYIRLPSAVANDATRAVEAIQAGP
jgi:phosphate transport system substrate-binding protein